MPNSLTDWFHQRASRAPRTRASFGQSVGQSRLEARGRITCRFRPVMVRKVEWNKKLGKLVVSGEWRNARTDAGQTVQPTSHGSDRWTNTKFFFLGVSTVHRRLI